MSSSSDTSKCVASSSSSIKEEAPEISSNKKVSTSCDQKDESCNNDGVPLNNDTSFSSNAFRFDVPSDNNDELTIASSPSKNLFVFGSIDASGQTQFEQHKKDIMSSDFDNTASNSSSRIDAVSDSLGKVNISNDEGKMAIFEEKLFADPPPKVDCPICFLPMPFTAGLCGVNTIYMPCCGKTICDGCSSAEDDEIEKGNLKPWCACCRVPLHNTDIKSISKDIRKE